MTSDISFAAARYHAARHHAAPAGEERVVAAQARQTSGLLRVNIATVFFGLAGVLGKLSGLPAPTITLGRVVFAGLALGALATHARTSLRPHTRTDIALLVGQGLILAVHWTAFFQSIVVSSVAIGLLAFSCFPLFTALFEPLILGQRPRAIELVAALLILPGVYLLAPRLTPGDRATQGVLWGLLAAATFALLSVLNRGLTRRYTPLTISLYQDTFAALALLPTLVFFPLGADLSARSLLSLLALGILCTALAHTLFISGLREVRAQAASLVAALEPVWGIGFAFVILAETPATRTLIGGALILGATLLPTLFPDRAKPEPPASASPAHTTSATSTSDREPERSAQTPRSAPCPK